MQTPHNFLEIHTFGHVIVTDQTTRTTVTLAPREEALLVYLAYHGIAISRAQLCELFWPDEPQSRARGNLRKLLTDIRKSLGTFVMTDREAVWLIEGHYWLDVHEFQRHIQPATQPRTISQVPADSDIMHLSKAVQIYHGDFLANFKQPQSQRFAQWIEERQLALHEQAIAAFKQLIAYYIEANQFTQAALHAKRLLELDPLDEEANEHLMRLLAQQNQIPAALTHYQSYVQLVKSATGTTVEPELTELYQQLKAGIIPTLSAYPQLRAEVQLRQRELKGTQIPQPLTPLIGRTVLLTQLGQYLQSATIRLITLTGLGGVGKSRVALALVEPAKSQFVDGLFYIPLHAAPPTSATGSPAASPQPHAWPLLEATSQALGLRVRAETDAESLLLNIAAHLRNRNLLLIFDGFEQHIDDAPYLIRLLQDAPLTKILVTSREVLQLPGELVVQVEGLGFTEGTDFRHPAEINPTSAENPMHFQFAENAEQMAQFEQSPIGLPYASAHGTAQPEMFATTEEAVQDEVLRQRFFAGEFDLNLRDAPCVQLFTFSAERHAPEITFTATCIRQIAQICYLLEGNPLAIELAAGLIHHYQYAELITLLQENSGVLDTLSRGRATKQHSMQSVLEESWHTLSPVEQKTLAELSNLRSAFSRDKALQMDGISPATLIGLTQKSLVRAIGHGRYRLPYIVQMFATQKRHQFNTKLRSSA